MLSIISWPVVLFFSISVLNYGEVQSSNILFFHLAATSSHRTSIWPLAEKLANKGHNVTYIFPILKKVGSHPNVKEITPSKMIPIAKDFGGNLDINIKLNNTLHKFYERGFDAGLALCEAFYDSPEIKEWLKTPNLHFDLFMIDSTFSECVYGLVHKFKAKHIIFAPAIPPFSWDGFGIVPESASVPPMLSSGGVPPKVSEMGLVNRIIATLEPILWRLGYLYLCLPKMKAIIEDKMNITGFPDLEEIERNTSLIMANLHIVEEFPYATPPYLVSYSGLWCSRDKVKARKPLPKDLEQFVEQVDSDGFVYVSLGSSVIASAMPVELRDNFFEAFRLFPKLQFLWRWTGEVPLNKPENLWMQSWFPQHDILAHPKIKGFVTQCGRPSTQEALCHGVPLITIPIFGDQDYNADRMEQVGAAINIDIMSMTTEKLKEAIQNLVYTDKYKTRMSELSQIFKDRPIDPLDNALYWTEYVLRQKDTNLMKPLGLHLTWYQRRLLDVYLVVAVSLITVLAILLTVIFFAIKLVRMLFRKSTVECIKNKTD